MHYQIGKNPEYLTKHISEFLYDIGAHKNQHTSLYELFQTEKAREKMKTKERLSRQEKQMLKEQFPYLEAREKKAKDEKYSSKPAHTQLYK